MPPGSRPLLAVSMLLLLAAGFLPGCGEPAPAARVNDTTISFQELRDFIALMRLLNPPLDLLWEEQGAQGRKELEKELLEYLIGLELVRQEAASLELAPDRQLLEERMQEQLQELVQVHYNGSEKNFEKQRKRLGVDRKSLELLPAFELLLQALCDRVAGTVTEEDLRHYVEENPEMLRQPAALEVEKFIFDEEDRAEEALKRLQAGAESGEPGGRSWAEAEALEVRSLGWISADDPFLEQEVKEMLFALPGAGTGVVYASAEKYQVFWINRTREETRQSFEEVREEAEKAHKALLYQEYFNSLWEKSRIEIFI